MIMRFKSYLVSALIATSFVACKVDYDAVPAAPYGGELQVSFNNYLDDDGNFGYLVKDMAIKDTLIDLGVEIKLANTTSAAPQDINVYVKKVDAVVGDYNTLTGNLFTPIPSASPAITYDFSKPIVIKKGQRRAFVNLVVNPSKLDLSKQNAFGLAIADVKNGASVAQGTLGKLVVNINIRNKYDGYYSIRGRSEHPTNGTLTGLVGPYIDAPLITVGANSVVYGFRHPWANGSNSALPDGYEPVLTINPVTDAVTVTNTLIGAENVPNTDSKYIETPTSKTIYAAWRYQIGGAYRNFYDTLVFIRPR